MIAIRDNWIAIALSTDPADRPRAEAGVRMAYRRAGLAESVRIVWASSPANGSIIASALMRRATRMRTPVAGARPTAAMLRDAFERVSPDEAAALRHAVVEPIVSRVIERVWKPIHRQVASLARPMMTPAYGQHDAPWLAFSDVLGQSGVDVSGMESSAEIAQSCGWWWPFDDVCVLSERHSFLSFDGEGRLHAERGPAVKYPDGWSIRCRHGIVMSADVGRLDRRTNVGGTPAAASQTAAIESDWVAAILRREHR